MSDLINAAIDATVNIRPQARTLDSVHPEYAAMSPQQKQELAFQRLEKHIADGRKRAEGAVNRIMAEVPNDAIVRAGAFRVDAQERGFLARVGDRELGTMHDHALRQLASRLGLRGQQLTDLMGKGKWGRDLVATCLNTMAEHNEGDKFLVRRVGADPESGAGGQVRGVLSNSYGRDDSRPAVAAFIEVAKEVGAVIADGVALDVRNSIKMMVERPIEIFPGEWAVVGLDFRTSDYGAGAREICGWILRLLCLNGAVTTTQFRKVHIGRRLEDDAAEYSDRTRRLNEQFTASATRDMARALLGPEAIAKMVDRVRAANADQLNPDAAIASLRKRVNKEEEKQIVAKYNSPDVEELPPGNTTWRWSNAVSWLAREQVDGERKLELERLAGEILDNMRAREAQAA